MHFVSVVIRKCEISLPLFIKNKFLEEINMSCKNNQYCKSTLSAYTDATITLEQGDLMPINTNQSLTGTSITHTA